jgi:competence CoiA-like predicted nuclease
MIERALEHVRDLQSGRDYSAAKFFAQSEGEIFKARRSCVEGKSALVCSLCNQRVYIAGTPRQEFIFKHYKERGDCPIKTAGRFSQEELDRIRYAGQRESELHKQLKNEIADSLVADAERCLDVRVEGVRRSSADPNLWRRPDVSCEFLGKKVVFEVQLSTTYLNVIVEREAHYREDRTYVIWLFANFDPTDLRFIHKDVLYSNHGNLFVFDEEARRRSAEGKKLFIHSYQFIRPTITTPGQWTDQFVDLAD